MQRLSCFVDTACDQSIFETHKHAIAALHGIDPHPDRPITFLPCVDVRVVLSRQISQNVLRYSSAAGQTTAIVRCQADPMPRSSSNAYACEAAPSCDSVGATGLTLTGRGKPSVNHRLLGASRAPRVVEARGYSFGRGST